MKYMKETAETARLIAEKRAKIAEVRARHSAEAIETCNGGYYGTFTFSKDPVTIEAAELNKELEEIRREYERKIDDSMEVATATEDEEAEIRAFWDQWGEGTYDIINAASERHPEDFR